MICFCPPDFVITLEKFLTNTNLLRSQKLLNFDDFIKEELKDSEFKKHFEEEGKNLAIGYKIAQLREKLGITQK